MVLVTTGTSLVVRRPTGLQFLTLGDHEIQGIKVESAPGRACILEQFYIAKVAFFPMVLKFIVFVDTVPSPSHHQSA